MRKIFRENQSSAGHFLKRELIFLFGRRINFSSKNCALFNAQKLRKINHFKSSGVVKGFEHLNEMRDTTVDKKEGNSEKLTLNIF